MPTGLASGKWPAKYSRTSRAMRTYLEQRPSFHSSGKCQTYARCGGSRTMVQVPPSFPATGHQGTLPGAQVKYTAREIDGKFVVGLTNEERFNRYEECLNIVRQLVPLFHEQLQRHPDFDEARHFARLRNGLRAKQWRVTNAEIDWMVDQVRRQTIASEAAPPAAPDGSRSTRWPGAND